MAESYIVRKGGGGADINALIESYKVRAGESISAGDFVDYVNEASFTATPVVGGKVDFTSNNITDISAKLLDTNKVLVAYRNQVNTQGQCLVLSITGTTITAGNVATFASGNTSFPSIAVLNSNRAMIAYTNNGDSQRGQYAMVSISGTTVTNQSTAGFNSVVMQEINAITLNSSTVFVSYRTTSSIGGAVTVSFSTPSSQGQVNNTFAFTTTGIDSVTSTMLDSNRVLVAYRQSTLGTARILNISGTTISAPSPAVVFQNSDTRNMSPVALDSSRVLIAYRNEANSFGTAVIVSVSGTTITPNTSVIFQNSSIDATSAIKINNNTVFVSYRNLGNSNFGTSQILLVSDTTITTGTPFLFQNTPLGDVNTGGITPINTIDLSNGVILNVFNRPSAPTFGASKLITFKENFVVSATEQVLGVAKTSGTGGQTIDVYVDETARPFVVQQNLVQYPVYPGNTIPAGRFVNFVQDANFTTLPAAELTPQTTEFVNTIKLNSQKVLTIFPDPNNSNTKQYRIVDTSVSPPTFTTATTFQTFSPGNIDAVMLTATTGIVTWRRDNAANNNSTIYVKKMTFDNATNTITFGTETQVDPTSVDGNPLQIIRINDTDAVIMYTGNQTASMRSHIIRDNGTSTLTVGAIATNYNSPGCNFVDRDRNNHIVKLNATTIAYFYKPGCSSSSNITYNIANLNLTNLTISFLSATSTSSPGYFNVTNWGENRLLIHDVGGGNLSGVRAASYSGSGNSLTFGTATGLYTFNSNDRVKMYNDENGITSGFVYTSGSSSTSTPLFYLFKGQDPNNGSPTYVTAVTLSTNRNISTSVVFAAALFNENKVFSARKDSSQSNQPGFFQNYEKFNGVIPATTSTVLGLSKNSGTGGQIIGVFVNT